MLGALVYLQVGLGGEPLLAVAAGVVPLALVHHLHVAPSVHQAKHYGYFIIR